jgi:hypothetical protein
MERSVCEPVPLPEPAAPDRAGEMVGSRGTCDSGVQSSLRLPRLSGLDLRSWLSGVHVDGFPEESDELVVRARGS